MDLQPSRKRSRSNTMENDTLPEPTTSFEKVQAATRDSDYWFDHGDLILVSKGVTFRIYKGLLAEHSTVFCNMCHVAQAAPAAEELVDECPVVPLDDSPNDLRELFQLIYPVSATLKLNEPARKVDAAFLSAIIRLGYKYELDGLYNQAMGYLTTYYTTSFDDWIDGRNAAKRRSRPVHAITAINLARLTNTTSILPTAFYVCATLGPDIALGAPLEDGTTEQLTPEDMHLVFELKARLADENSRAAFLLFQPEMAQACSGFTGSCTSAWHKILECAGKRGVSHRVASARALDSWMEHAELPTVPLIERFDPRYDPACAAERYPSLCKGCRDRLRVRERELRREAWRKLPEFLGLTIENWDA